MYTLGAASRAGSDTSDFADNGLTAPDPSSRSLLFQARVEFDLRSGQGLRYGAVLFGCLGLFLEDLVIDAGHFSFRCQFNGGDFEAFTPLVDMESKPLAHR